MGLDISGLGSVFDFGGKLLDKLFPDPEEKAAAEAKLISLAQSGELKELEVRMSAIIAEANSKDPWTSRARPSFLYVVYLIILAAIPMGFLHALRPEIAVNVSAGFQNWLAAIPGDMWWLFGAGYLGYTGGRTLEKRKGKA